MAMICQAADYNYNHEDVTVDINGGDSVTYSWSVTLANLGVPSGLSFDTSTGATTVSPPKMNPPVVSSSSASGSLIYTRSELPTSDVSMVMDGKLVGGSSGGSQLTWHATAKAKKPFYIEASPGGTNDIIVPLGTSITYDATETSKWKINGTSPDDDPSTSSIIFNRSLWDVAGWFDTSVGSPDAGPYTIWASPVDSSVSDSGSMKVVEVSSISVSGATHIGSTKNWGVVKGTGNVTITAILNPAIAEEDIPDGFITWSGGTAVAGHPLQRTVSKTTSAKTTVTVTCGTSSKEVDIWVIWSTIALRKSDEMSTNNDVTFPASVGGNKLGPLTDEDDGILAEARGKVEIVVTLSPTGIYDVISTGWDIKRWIVNQDYANGTALTPENRDDTSVSSNKDLTPDSDDKIYDNDAPSCGSGYFYHTKEVYSNFTQWVTWNNTQCSSDFEWHYRARVDDDLDAENKPDNDDTELNDVDTGHETIPSSAYYPTRQ